MGVFAVILGILALILAFPAAFLFGTAGGIVAGVLGLLAIVLGFLKRKRDQKGGIASAVIGVLAIILAITMTGTSSAMFRELHNKAIELKPDGLWAQYSEETNGGLFGIINRMPKDEASMNALMDEMNELSKMSESK